MQRDFDMAIRILIVLRSRSELKSQVSTLLLLTYFIFVVDFMFNLCLFGVLLCYCSLLVLIVNRIFVLVVLMILINTIRSPYRTRKKVSYIFVPIWGHMFSNLGSHFLQLGVTFFPILGFPKVYPLQ